MARYCSVTGIRAKTHSERQFYLLHNIEWTHNTKSLYWFRKALLSPSWPWAGLAHTRPTGQASLPSLNQELGETPGNGSGKLQRAVPAGKGLPAPDASPERLPRGSGRALRLKEVSMEGGEW